MYMLAVKPIMPTVENKHCYALCGIGPWICTTLQGKFVDLDVPVERWIRLYAPMESLMIVLYALVMNG